MNNIESNERLSLNNNCHFLSPFPSGIEYCDYEQQIDISSSLLNEEKQQITFGVKIQQILVTCQNWLTKHNYQKNKQSKNKLLNQSKLILKKISADTAWKSSLLALTSVGIASELIPICFNFHQNSFLRFASQGSISQEKYSDRYNDLQVLKSINHSESRQKWLTYQTQVSGSLMAIPPVQHQPSLAGFTLFLSTGDLMDSPNQFSLSQSILFNNYEFSTYPLNSDSYHIEGKLMAMPQSTYKL